MVAIFGNVSFSAESELGVDAGNLARTKGQDEWRKQSIPASQNKPKIIQKKVRGSPGGMLPAEILAVKMKAAWQ